MRITKTSPLKKPKKLNEEDKEKIRQIVKSCKHLFNKTELRIYKSEIENV